MRGKAHLLPLLIWLAIPVCISTAVAQTGDVAVVINSDNPATKLSRTDLRKIFAGEKRSWPAGLPIRLFVRAPGTHERVMLLKLLGMTESEYKRYWTTQVLRGEAQAEPIALPSNGMQREAVVAYPGAIALVDAQDIKPGMKVVRVEGCMPGDDGYPLH
jgi:ABC-type phosphate transport system substrate-binding protein